MTSKEAFDNALSFLQNRLQLWEESSEVWTVFHRIRSIFDTAEPWSFLNEIIQNSVDAGARNIRMSVGDNTVDIQHDGSEPLNADAVQGLCGFALSTKGLDSVGFMGIGFKSFTGFFERVTISDDGISFLLQAPFKGKQVDLKALYSPTWVSKPLDRHTGMTTAFSFQGPKGNTITQFSQVPNSINLMDLAVIGSGSSSLETLRIDNYEFRINNEGNNVISVTVSKDGDEINKMHCLVLETEVSFDEEATDEMKAHRLVREKDKDIKTITRKVRLLKEFDTEICEDGNLQKLIPKKIVKARSSWNTPKKYPGKMFCLVSLGQDFPFNIGIDSDWLMDAERNNLRPEPEAGSWHRQLLSSLPELIRQYFEWLPDNLSPEERATALDIFPDALWEPTTGLEFTVDDAFKEILREKLSNCNFILCSDGNLRSPSEARDIPEKPKDMDYEVYESLIRDCFTCPILDRKAIQSNAIDYLEKLTGFLPFPEISEMNEEVIKDLWNEDDPDDYKHILDILTEITTHNEKDEQKLKTRGPKVLPDARGSIWTNILGPQLAFWPLPNRAGVERPIHVALINSHPDVKDTIEVHKSLRGINKHDWKKPGFHWREESRNSSTKIMEKVTGLNLPRDNENVLAMFCYCLRIDKPEDITFLTSTRGPIRKEECVIGPPFANEKIELMFPDHMFTYEGPKDKVKDKKKVNDFLKRAGAIFVKPTLLSEEMNEDQTKDFLRGKPAPSGKQSGQKYEARDWTWGIQLDGCKDMKVLSRYLSKPDKELREAIKEARSYLQLKYKYGNRNYSPEYSSLDCSWVTELRDVAWVLCADGELRKPNDASLPPQGEAPIGKQATMAEETAELYTEKGIRFGPDLPDDPEEALQSWKTQPASREPKLFNKYVKKLKKENKISPDDLLDLVGEVLWVTSKSTAPLRRFIDNEDFDDWDGFLGKWSIIDAGIRDTLEEEIGFKPNSTIDSSMAKEMVKKFSRTNLGVNNDRSWDCLSQANSIILAENPDEFENGRFLRYDGNWSSDNETAYIQLIGDKHRFGDFESRIIRPEQLPKELEALGHILSNSDHPNLIDNEAEVNDPALQSSMAQINIQRLMSSLHLPFEFEVRCYDQYPLSVSLEGKKSTAHYLIQYNPDISEVTFHLSDDRNRWSNKVASFLTNQIQAPTSLKDTISECLGAAHSNQDFDDASQMLGDEGIDMLPRASSADQPDSGQESDDGTESLSRPPKQRGTLNEPLGQPDVVTKEELERGRKGTKSSKKPKDSDKRDKAKVRIKGKTGKQLAAERKKTGKAAEEIVLDALKNEGWDPLSWNDELGERVGHDLVFKRGKEVRVVEVKGHSGEWTGEQDISEAQLRMGLIYHGKEPEKHPGCKYSVWLYVVENVYGEYNIRQINWPEKNISAYFSRNTWAPRKKDNDDD